MPSTSAVRVPTGPWRPLVVMVGLVAVLMTTLSGTASAHGSTSDPPSRLYHCFHATDRFDPGLATTNPMCAQAWAAEPQALYDWPALLTTEGDTPYQDVIPDGEICSAGLDKYAALDEPGEWDATEVDNDFTLTFTSTAPHETEFYRIYVTRQGFDLTTDELTWDDLDLVHESGRLPAASEDVFEVSAPGRSGHHIVYLQWRRLPGHSPETFLACSDVIFPGGEDGGQPAPQASDDSGEQPTPEGPGGGGADEPAEGTGAPAAEAPDDTGDEAPDSGGPAPAGPDDDARKAPAPEPAGGGFAAILEWLLGLLSNLFAMVSRF